MAVERAAGGTNVPEGEDLADRAGRARWRSRAEKARAAVVAEFARRRRHLPGEWCDFDQAVT